MSFITKHLCYVLKFVKSVFELIGNTPLVKLREKFGFPSSRFQASGSNTSTKVPTIPIVIVKAGLKKAGLVVDSFLGQQEVVIKPLAGILKKIKGVSGATILGTGKPALIVDIGSLL